MNAFGAWVAIFSLTATAYASTEAYLNRYNVPHQSKRYRYRWARRSFVIFLVAVALAIWG